ncbi:hypothetical protein [Methanoculleus sp.]|uniref:hypothetical protein n=1 Tax=Methanoculleus sp. TaxID=90427 RepID=UPI002606BE2E|nr:hypothetical protein [Methanoculleus sp.]MDD2255201.1 hypothetical protein [Methanoculleus sp.]
MTRPVIVSHVHFAGDLKKRLTNIEGVLASEEVGIALAKTANDIDHLWESTIYEYFNTTRNMQITSFDKKVRIVTPMNQKGEWKETPRWFTRSTSGQLGRACRVRVSKAGRISISMGKLPQTTSTKKQWVTSDYGDFLRRGIGPSQGGYDPPSGKRMIISDDDGTVWWACGYHPGFTNKKWRKFMENFKREYKEVVVRNMRGALMKVLTND